MPAQNQKPASGAKAAGPRNAFAKIASDPKRATAVVNFISGGVEAISKLSPSLGGSLGVVGNVMDGVAMVTNGAGIYTTLQQDDKSALAGYTLSFGISALGLIGTATGNTTLRDAAMVLKVAHSGVTTLATVFAD